MVKVGAIDSLADGEERQWRVFSIKSRFNRSR